jgi:hypothetical protein
MNTKLLFHAFIYLLTLCASSNAQQTFKPKDKEPSWTYNTIAELHDLAKRHLASLDTQIADKKAVSESMMNPFKKTAKENYDQLAKKRKDFLDQEWNCPYWFWQKCGRCDGTGAIWLGFKTCPNCNGNKGHNQHGDHSGADKVHSCEPSTIRALLKVAD